MGKLKVKPYPQEPAVPLQSPQAPLVRVDSREQGGDSTQEPGAAIGLPRLKLKLKPLQEVPAAVPGGAKERDDFAGEGQDSGQPPQQSTVEPAREGPVQAPAVAAGHDGSVGECSDSGETKEQANARLLSKLIAHPDLSGWECDFLHTLAKEKKFSIRQQKVFDELVERSLEGAPFIPPRTREEIQNPAPEGQRHDQALRIAISMLGQGFNENAVAAQLRGMYAESMTDREIRDIIAWAVSKNPSALGRSGDRRESRPVPVPERVSAKQATDNVEKWLDGFRVEEVDWWERAPWRPLEDWRLDSLMLLAALYDRGEFVNVVTDFTIEQKDGNQKANPVGAGKTMLRDDWMRSIRDHGVPQSDAGGWIRPNPVKEHGSGVKGAVCNCDVTAYRFCLLESDDLPLELQLSFFARLPLPISAIIDSGGRSAHAWVRLDCDSAEEYQTLVERIYARLTQFGLCQNNKNRSRLSRLPGAQRTIGKRETSSSSLSAVALRQARADDGAQRLLYLNPEPLAAPVFERKK